MIAVGPKVFLRAVTTVSREPWNGWSETAPDSKPTLVAL